MNAAAWIGLVPALAPLVGVLGSIKFIQEGQRGAKLRFGKAVRDRSGQPRIYGPGFVFALPSVHSLRRLSVRQHTLNCYDQTVMLADRNVFTFSAVVLYKIHDSDDAVYRALFEIDNLTHAIEDYTTSALRDVVGHRTASTLDLTDIGEEVSTVVNAKLAEWGVDLVLFRFTDCSPTPATAETLLIASRVQARTDAVAAARQSLETNDPGLLAALVGVPVTSTVTGGHANMADRDRPSRLSDGPVEGPSLMESARRIFGKAAADEGE